MSHFRQGHPRKIEHILPEVPSWKGCTLQPIEGHKKPGRTDRSGPENTDKTAWPALSFHREQDTATIIYTSVPRNPKGVMLSHFNIAEQCQDIYHISCR